MIGTARAHDGHVHVTDRNDGQGSNAPQLLEEMDAHGIGCAAVVTPSTMGWNNDVSFDAAKENPDRFIVIARVDLDSENAVGALTEALDRGAAGIRITTFETDDLTWLGNDRMREVSTILAGRSAVAEFHCRPNQLLDVADFARREPTLPVVIDHLGRPGPSAGTADPAFQTFLALSEVPNLYAKTADSSFFSQQRSPYLDLAPFLEAAIAAWGSDRILWGSDWPQSVERDSYADSLEPTSTILANRTAQERHDVFLGTFEKLFLRSSAASVQA